MNNSREWEAFLTAAKEIEKDYQAELEKVKMLTQELLAVRTEYDKISRKYSEEKKRTQELEVLLRNDENAKLLRDEIGQIKTQVQQNIRQLQEETERLKSVYPIYDLLSAKQAEVERMKKSLTKVSQDHPERSIIESMVKSHIVERDELRWIVQDAENRFKLQLEKIQSVFSSLAEIEVSSGSVDGAMRKGRSKNLVRVPEH